MMMHPVTVQELHEARYRDLLKQAETWRIPRQAEMEQSTRPSLIERIVDGVSTLLVNAGKRLTERYALLE